MITATRGTGDEGRRCSARLRPYAFGQKEMFHCDAGATRRGDALIARFLFGKMIRCQVYRIRKGERFPPSGKNGISFFEQECLNGFPLERNIAIVRGDSGTGKTKKRFTPEEMKRLIMPC